MGVLGFEIYNTSALLRSLAVYPPFKKRGIAKQLIEHVLNNVRHHRCDTAYLLTNTAADYLCTYGFVPIDRNDIPSDILTTSALGDVCPMSSTCMALKL